MFFTIRFYDIVQKSHDLKMLLNNESFLFESWTKESGYEYYNKKNLAIISMNSYNVVSNIIPIYNIPMAQQKEIA